MESSTPTGQTTLTTAVASSSARPTTRATTLPIRVRREQLELEAVNLMKRIASSRAASETPPLDAGSLLADARLLHLATGSFQRAWTEGTEYISAQPEGQQEALFTAFAAPFPHLEKLVPGLPDNSPAQLLAAANSLLQELDMLLAAAKDERSRSITPASARSQSVEFGLDQNPQALIPFGQGIRDIEMRSNFLNQSQPIAQSTPAGLPAQQRVTTALVKPPFFSNTIIAAQQQQQPNVEAAIVSTTSTTCCPITTAVPNTAGFFETNGSIPLCQAVPVRVQQPNAAVTYVMDYHNTGLNPPLMTTRPVVSKVGTQPQPGTQFINPFPTTVPLSQPAAPPFTVPSYPRTQPVPLPPPIQPYGWANLGQGGVPPYPAPYTPYISTFNAPRLQPPTFAGDPKDWLAFWTYFERAIHLQSIPAFEKQLHLLRCLPEGSPARRAVEAYAPSDANYPVVIAILHERFGRSEDLERSLRSALLQLSPAKDNPASLCALVEEFERIVCHLQQLGVNTEDGSFQTLLEAKLPLKILTQMKLEEARGGRSWNSTEFRRAVSSYCRCLRSAESALASMKPEESQPERKPKEAITVGKKQQAPIKRVFAVTSDDKGSEFAAINPVAAAAVPVSPKPPVRRNQTKNGKKGGKGGSRGGPPACSFCELDGHLPSKCPTYSSAQQRRVRAVEQRRCLACLRSDHLLPACKIKKVCSYCGQDNHHPLLCTQSQIKLATKESDGMRMPSSHPGATSKLDKPVMLTALRENSRPFEGAANPNSAMNPTLAAVPKGLSTYLMTRSVVVSHGPCENRSPDPKTTKCFVIFDSGSYAEFVARSLIDRIKPDPVRTDHIRTQTFGGGSHSQPSLVFRLRIQREDGKWEWLDEVMEVKQICKPFRMANYANSGWPITPKKGERPNSVLAAPELLIGIKRFWHFINGAHLLESGLYQINTVFGPVLGGGTFELPLCRPERPLKLAMSVLPPDHPGADVMPSISAVELFWSLETLGINDDPAQDDDAVAEQHFLHNVKRLSDGRYSVCWPWREVHPPLPSNFQLAYRRLLSAIKRLQTMPEVLAKYQEVIQEQLDQGIIEPATAGTERLEHFIPHQAVITPKKLRVVYDASAHTRAAPSLNQCLLRGPVILPDLAGMLLRFFTCKLPVIADIEKAFLQVGLEPTDREVCKFLWVKDPRKPLTADNMSVFRFTRIPFGVVSSPFLLAAVINFHLAHSDQPIVKQLWKNNYVDNILIPCDEAGEAIEAARQAKELFAEARMNLREFLSPDPKVNASFASTDFLGKTETKMLGIPWDAEADLIKIPFPSWNPAAPYSRRSVLATIAGIFDPLGLAAPCVLTAKKFFQRLWDSTHSWDVPLDPDDQETWYSLTQAWNGQLLTVERFALLPKWQNLQLHVFTDASDSSFAAAVFIRSASSFATSSRLLFAKSRLKPKKASDRFTTPRMELLGILLGVRAAIFVRSQLRCTLQDQTFLWSDSRIALSWIKATTVPQPIFNQNRLEEIRSHKEFQFHFVRTDDNPADLATRGSNPEQLSQSAMWWNGPSWLCRETEEWPDEFSFRLNDSPGDTTNPDNELTNDLLERPLFVVPEQPFLPLVDLTRFSSLKRAKRVVAWILLFVSCCRKENKAERRPRGRSAFSANELAEAENALIRWEQRQNKMPEIRMRLDTNQILRFHSRIIYCEEPESVSQPIVLPKSSRLASLFIFQIHSLQLNHAGVDTTLTTFLQHFWTPAARKQVRSVVKQCIQCRRLDAPKFALPQMPPLPPDRVQRRIPFETVGLDYLGPTVTLDDSGKQVKTWVVLITCLAVRAVYLEAIRSLSASAFVNVLRRFIARRGSPKRIISDNAPHFLLASRTLRTLTAQPADQITAELADRGICWTFIPQYSPWAGGIYERLVGIAKRCMQKTLGHTALDFDSFSSALAEVEAAMNLRPLTYVASEKDSPLPLRPVDFLQENNALNIPAHTNPISAPIRDQTQQQLIAFWRSSQQRINQFWERWRKEYLQALRERAGWQHKGPRCQIDRPPKVGDIVLIEESLQPRNIWPIGRVEALNGQAPKIRSVQIRMPNGRIWVRPINKICPLEVGPLAADSSPPDSHKEVEEPAESFPNGAEAGSTHQLENSNQPEVDHPPPLPDSSEELASFSEELANSPTIEPQQNGQKNGQNSPPQLAESNQKTIGAAESANTNAPTNAMSLRPRATLKPVYSKSLYLTLLALFFVCLTPIGKCQQGILDRIHMPPPSHHLFANCSLSCSDSGVLLNFPASVHKAEICCQNECWSTVTDSSPISYELSRDILLNEYSCSGKCWQNAQKFQQTAVYCPAKNICGLIECWLCVDQIANPSCNPRLTALMVGFLGSSFLLTLGLCWSCLLRIKTGGMAIWVVLAWCLAQAIHLFNLLTGRHIPAPSPIRLQNRARKGTRRIFNGLETASRRLRAARAAVFPMPPATLGHFVAVVALISAAIAPTLSSNFVSITTKTKTCHRNNAGLTCNVNLATTLTLLPAGQANTLIIQDDHGATLGSLAFTLRQLSLICLPVTEAWHRSYSIKAKASKRCWKAGSCMENFCAAVRSETAIQELSELNHLPGHSFCLDSKGWLHRGCAYPYACLFYRWAANPLSQLVYEEFSCPDWDPQIGVHIQLETNGGNRREKNFVLHPGISSEWGNITLAVLGYSMPPSPLLSSRFLTDGNSVAQTSPIQSDFHCSTEEAAAAFNCSLDIQACHACSPDHENGNVTCHCRERNFDNWMGDPSKRLPLSRSRIYLHHDGPILKADYAYAPVQINIQLADLQLIAEFTGTRCSVQPVNLTGCYRCPNGAHLKAICHTNFGTALATITCQDGTLLAIHCSANGTEQSIPVAFDRAEINTACNVDCPAGQTQFHLTGQLHYVPIRHQFGYRQRVAPALVEGAEAWSWPFDLSFDPFVILRLLGGGKVFLLAIFALCAGLLALWLVVYLNPIFRTYRLIGRHLLQQQALLLAVIILSFVLPNAAWPIQAENAYSQVTGPHVDRGVWPSIYLTEFILLIPIPICLLLAWKHCHLNRIGPVATPPSIPEPEAIQIMPPSFQLVPLT